MLLWWPLSLSITTGVARFIITVNTAYQFTRVRLSDMPMLRQWLATPDVRKWWGDPKEQAALLLQDLRDSRMTMTMNLVNLDGEAFAYIQDYEVHAWPQPHLRSLPSGARAIDTFIGLPTHVGVGHGSAYLKQRAQQLVDAGAPVVVIDPDVTNKRAIRAYENAGFTETSVEQTDEGPVVLMQYQQGSVRL
jgi:aminoglycoside 6'-N-acetyltransferase